MSSAKCLAIFFAFTTSPTARPISTAARKGEPLRRTCAWIRASSPFGRTEKRLALAGTLRCQIAIAAHDQPLSREVRRADLRQVPLVKQRELQRAVLLCQGPGSAARAER